MVIAALSAAVKKWEQPSAHQQMIGLRSCGDGFPAVQTVKDPPERQETPV